jgi:hypothetical protein
MLVCRILGKDRLWRKKRLFKNKPVFRVSGNDPTDYQIHGDCIYWYKMLGIKLFRCIDFKEGCKDPLSYDGIQPVTTTSMFSLDEGAYIIGKAMKSFYLTIILILSAVSLVTLVIVAMKVFGLLEKGG